MMDMSAKGSNGSGAPHEGEPITSPKRGRPKNEAPVEVVKASSVVVPKRTAEVTTYIVTCSQKSPLLMDQFEEGEMVAALVKGQRKPKDTESLLEERCIPKIYRNADGHPILRSDHLLATLRAAGRSIKIGKDGKISTAKETKLFSFLELDEFEIPLIFPEGKDPLATVPSRGGEKTNDPSSPWRVDVRRGVGEATGIANVLIRPMFEQWGFRCTIRVDFGALDGLTEGHVGQLLERAGNRVGLLSYRPACNGPFGRFRVDSIIASHEE